MTEQYRKDVACSDCSSSLLPNFAHRLFESTVVRNAHEALTVLFHTFMLENRFSPKDVPEEEKYLCMPKNWSADGVFKIFYIHSCCPQFSCCMTCVPLYKTIAVHGIICDIDCPDIVHFKVHIEQYLCQKPNFLSISEVFHNVDELFRNFMDAFYLPLLNLLHEKLKLALIQSAVLTNKELNVERICKYIKEAAQNGAKLICLPECFNSPYGVNYFSEYSEEIPGFTSKALSESAKDNDIYLIGGTFPERDNGKLYNTCLAFGPDGEIIAKHRKVHLFDIDIPGKITFKESACLNAGDNLTVFSLDKWKIGLGICYDIRFPLMANIYAEKGCQLLVYPGAFNMTTCTAHWELLQRARAVDNQLYVAAVSPARDVNASYVSWGHSSLVNPWGDVICAADESEKIVYGEIDMSYVDEIRAQIPIRNQQRHDIYKIKCTKEF